MKLAGVKDLAGWLEPQNSGWIFTSPMGSLDNGHISLRVEDPSRMGASFRQSSGQEPRLIVSLGIDPNMVAIEFFYDPKTGDRVEISVSPGGISGRNSYNNHDGFAKALLKKMPDLATSVGVAGLFTARAADAAGVEVGGGYKFTHRSTRSDLDTRDIEVANRAIRLINEQLYSKAGPIPRF